MADLSTVPNYTDQDILKVLRMSLVNTAFAKDYSVNGRQLSRMSGSEIQALISEYEWRIARATSGIFVVGSNRSPE